MKPMNHLLILALAGAGTVTVAAADVLEEVVVTAQKREQNLQDVPVAVTAIEGDQIVALGLTRNVEIASQTPGLMFAEGSEQLINVSSIRGVSQNDVGFHLEPPNAVYVDQAYISVLSASNFQMFDLDRVEVLKGPQGTLFGRNATGGLLHFVSRGPTAEPGGYGDLRFGTESQIRFEGALGGSLGDSVSGRLSVLSDQYDGYAWNTTLNRDFRGREEQAVRGQLQIDFDEDVSLRLIGFYGEQDTELGYKHSTVAVNADGLLVSLPRDVDFWGTCPGCDPSGHREASPDPFVGEQDTDGFFDSETAYGTAILEWHFDDVTFTSVTHAFGYEAAHREDGEMSPRPGFDLVSGQDSDNFTQELRVAGDTARMRWIAGLYYLDREATSSQNAIVNLQYFDDVLSTFGAIPPGFVAGFGTTDNLLSDWTMETSSIAGFVQTEFDFGDAWTLVTGLRYTDDDLDFDFQSREFIDGFPIGPGGLLGETAARESKGESDWSGKLMLEWRPLDDWLVYGGYSRGIKSGGWNAPFLGGTVTEFDGETLDSLEAGLKATFWEGRGRLNLAAFYYDYSDYQGFTFVDLAARVSNLDASLHGMEAEFFWNPGDGWDVGVGLSVLDTTIEDVVLPSGRVADRTMPLAPEFSFNARVRKRWSAFGGEMDVTADYVWLDDHYSEALNNPSGLIDSYGIANLRIAWLAPGAAWEFALMAHNLADEEYLVYRTPIDLGFNQEHYGRPRWINGQVIYHWR